jgi:hypothetical protein
MSTSGSHQPIYGGGNDAFLVKFKQCTSSSVLGSIGAINSPSTSYCYGSSYTFTLSNTTSNASGYWWQLPVGWIIVSGQNTTSINVIAGVTGGAISVKAYNNCNDSTLSSQLNINISSPSQPGAIVGSTNICAGSLNISYSVPSVNGTLFRWILPQNWQMISGQNTNQIKVNIPSNAQGGKIVVYSSLQSDPSCEGIPRELNINVITIATPNPITGNTQVCAGSSFVYSVSQVTGATGYLWLSPTGWTGSSSTNSINLTFNNVSDTLRVKTIGSTGCLSLEQKLYIRILSSPQKPVIIGSNQVTPFSNNNYSATSNDVQNYEWLVTTGWSIVQGQGTANATIYSGNQPAILTINVINSCGSNSESTSINLTSSLDKKHIFRNLNIYPIPAIDILTLDYQLSNLGEIQWKINNIVGQNFLNGIINGNSNRETISLNGLISGIYVIEFMDENHNAYKFKFNVHSH